MNSFNDFGLAEPILRALTEEKYVTPTPIQDQTIPLLLAKRDVVGIAQTGTGKTAAFALPILNTLAANRVRPQPKTCRVLVLSPTRELSGQILDSFRAYGRHLRIQSTLAIGGVNMGPQVRALAHGVDVLVATPGRLLDLIQSHAVRLSEVEMFVLDEADRMLDMGFIRDIRKIVAKLPKERQTLLFSATMPQDIAELARHMLKDPAKVSVTPQATTVERIAQRIIHVDRGSKPKMLSDIILAGKDVDRVLVFTRTKHGADKVVRGLNKDGISAEAIHGNKSQNQRERVLKDFRNGRVKHAGGDRHRRPRHRRRGHQPRHQLRPAQHPGKLRAPHRPHRARRRRRHRDLAVLARRAAVPARHREADPDGDPRHRPELAAAPGASGRRSSSHGRPGQQQRNGQVPRRRRPQRRARGAAQRSEARPRAQ